MTTEDQGDLESPATERCDGGRPSGGAASVDAILEALANERRRTLLEFLRDRRQVTRAELIDHLRERESEAAGGKPAREDVELTLLHIHLPKLADAGVIEHDQRSGHVRYREDEQLETLLDHDRGESDG